MTEPRIPMEQALAEALRPSGAPAVLRASLLAAARAKDRTRRRYRAMMAAAVVVAGLTGAWAVLRGPGDPGLDLARAAVTRHASDSPLDFRGAPANPSAPCGSWCEKQLGYAATLPQSVSASDVVGGRVCTLQSHPVAYYRLSCGDGLFVFEQAPQALQRARGFDLQQGRSALAWTEGRRGYLRVTCDRP